MVLIFSFIFIRERVFIFFLYSRDGDAYSALRDCHEALQLDGSYVKAHLRLVQSLVALDHPERAETYLARFRADFAEHADSGFIATLEGDIRAKADAIKQREEKKNSYKRPSKLLYLFCGNRENVSIHLQTLTTSPTRKTLMTTRTKKTRAVPPPRAWRSPLTPPWTTPSPSAATATPPPTSRRPRSWAGTLSSWLRGRTTESSSSGRRPPPTSCASLKGTSPS